MFNGLLVSELRDVVVDCEDFDPSRVLAVVYDVEGARAGQKLMPRLWKVAALVWGSASVSRGLRAPFLA